MALLFKHVRVVSPTPYTSHGESSFGSATVHVDICVAHNKASPTHSLILPSQTHLGESPVVAYLHEANECCNLARMMRDHERVVGARGLHMT